MRLIVMANVSAVSWEYIVEAFVGQRRPGYCFSKYPCYMGSEMRECVDRPLRISWAAQVGCRVRLTR